MIISEKHRYLFIENPLTASWAIRQELCTYYDGKPILHKHATYPEFLRATGRAGRDYTVLISVRNPLDVLVSRYLKYKNDHRGAFSNPEAIQENWIDYSDLKKFEYVRRPDATFEGFFLKFYKRPYSDLVDLSTQDLDFVIRYEHLQEDFTEVLQRLNLQQVRPIPVRNKTDGKKPKWETYYTPRTMERAKSVCGPFMKKWGYAFPEGWGNYRFSWVKDMEFRMSCSLKNAYIYHLRNNPNPVAKFVRRMRAHLLN